jgi:hypothetical protein
MPKVASRPICNGMDARIAPEALADCDCGVPALRFTIPVPIEWTASRLFPIVSVMVGRPGEAAFDSVAFALVAAK